jgi:predicted nucleotidyltransferase
MIDRRSALVMKRLRHAGPARFTDLLEVLRNPRTLNSKLRMLVDLGWVEKAAGLYRLTPRGEEATDLIQQLEDLLSPAPAIEVERIPHPYFRPLLKVLTERMVQHFGDDLLGVLLFGSVARGDWTKYSDIDLLVLLRRMPRGLMGTMSKLLALRKELRRTREYERAFGAGYVPTVEFYPLALEDARRFRRIYLDAFTEGIVILDREGHLRDLMERFRRRMQEGGAKRVETPGRGHYWQLEDPRVLEGSL